MPALLQHGAKVDFRDEFEDTPLHAACWGHTEGIQIEAVVDLLLRRGTDKQP